MKSVVLFFQNSVPSDLFLLSSPHLSSLFSLPFPFPDFIAIVAQLEARWDLYSERLTWIIIAKIPSKYLHH